MTGSDSPSALLEEINRVGTSPDVEFPPLERSWVVALMPVAYLAGKAEWDLFDQRAASKTSRALDPSGGGARGQQKDKGEKCTNTLGVRSMVYASRLAQHHAIRRLIRALAAIGAL